MEEEYEDEDNPGMNQFGDEYEGRKPWPDDPLEKARYEEAEECFFDDLYAGFTQAIRDKIGSSDAWMLWAIERHLDKWSPEHRARLRRFVEERYHPDGRAKETLGEPDSVLPPEEDFEDDGIPF